MATRKAQTTRRTTIARLGCQCPFCNGTTVAADGVYPCRAGLVIEYIAYHQGAPIAFKATEMLAKTELNAYRRDLLTAPVEAAAEGADHEAEVAEFVAEVAAAQPTCLRCGAELTADGYCPFGCTLPPVTTPTPEPARTKDEYLDRLVSDLPPTDLRTAIETPWESYTAWVIERPESRPSPYAALYTAEITTPTGNTWASLPRATFEAARDEIAAYFSPAPLPPFIYPTPDGLTWSGAPEAYTDYTAADNARRAWLAELA